MLFGGRSVDTNTKGEEMRNKIDYEWCCEEWTCDRSDVLENYFMESVVDCYKVAKDLQTFSIVLRRNVWNEHEGQLAESYAYVDDGKLPVEFDCGAKVPKRFTVELQKALS